MKRLFSAISIFSLAAMLLLGLALPHSANAQVTCKNADASTGNGNPWPGGQYSQYCGTATSANGNKLFAVLKATQAPATKQLTMLGATFYLFGTPAEFLSYCGKNTSKFGGSCPASVMPSVPGITGYTASGHVPQYTAVFQTNGNNQTVTTLQNVASHEEGHWVDYIFRGLEGQSQQLSASTLFAHEVQFDYGTLNNKTNFPPCKLPSNVLGYFSNYADANGNFICDGTKGDGTALSDLYSGYADNWHVLLAAWIAIFSYNKEIFAEEWAVSSGWTDNSAAPESLDVYFTGSQGPNSQLKWVCTQYLMLTLRNTGILPTSAQFTAKGCPTS